MIAFNNILVLLYLIYLIQVVKIIFKITKSKINVI